MSRLGLFGGTFNPVHHGHLIAARRAQEAFALDEVRFLVSARPPHKAAAPELAPAPVRLELLRLALVGEPHFVADDCELRRAGPSYTLDTVRAARAARPGAEWYWLIGADTVADLPNWYEIRALLDEVTFLTIARPGCDPATLFAPLVPLCDAATLARHRAHFLACPPVGISSSELRARARAGRSLRALVPLAVADAIARRGLYRAGVSG